jgi:FdrA protein
MSGVVVNEVRRGAYMDSVALMRLSRTLAGLPGVMEATLMMATPSNKKVMQDAGILRSEGAAANPNDLVVAIKATDEATARAALEQVNVLLRAPKPAAPQSGSWSPRTLRAAARALPGANLALISLPGEYAVAEARNALAAGLHVMMFSDNVAIEDELALKQEGRAHDRLIMGPDCGTAILNGVPLAFANRVPRGGIGIVGASGTGMQEVSSLIARAGKGISQAIGVGGRDLSQHIGAISTLMAIDALDRDLDTERIVLVSKPPHPEVALKVLARTAESRKPFTICFLGARTMDMPPNARLASTLQGAAEDALGEALFGDFSPNLPPARLGRIAGLYCGGTLGAEAQVILLEAGRKVASNAAVPGADALEGGRASDTIVDLGADEFTIGRPHPMIDPSLREDMLRETLADASVAAVLIDVVIGFCAHPDPAGRLAPILADVRRRVPLVVASVTGTDQDPQVRARQVRVLHDAGAVVAPSNALAVRTALGYCDMQAAIR